MDMVAGGDALLTLARRNGIKSWWTGAELLVLRGGVMSAAQTSSYDIAKTAALKYKVVDDGPFLHFLSSTFASAGVTTLSPPPPLLPADSMCWVGRFAVPSELHPSPSLPRQCPLETAPCSVYADMR